MGKQKFNIILVVVVAVTLFFFLQSNKNVPVTEQGVEEQLAKTLSKIAGVGQVEVYLHTETIENERSILSSYFEDSSNRPSYTGVLIVSEGADSIEIKRQLTDTVSRVLQLPAHRIVILPMEKGGPQ